MKPGKSNLSISILISIVVLVSSCTRTANTSETPADTSISTAGLSEDFFSHPYFPHPDGWAEASSHGLRTLGNDETLADCLVCHDRDSTNLGSSGGTGTAPAGCKSCHAAFPHTEDWQDRANHAQYVLDNGTETCATTCHGTDLSGGLSNISCNTCHDNYPHSDTWQNIENHGRAALADTSSCVLCHGEDLTGGSSEISCTSCHSTYPHASNWKEKANHGQYVLDNSQSDCTGCHGTDLTGGESGVSCYQCHATYPHNGNWDNADEHGDTAKGNGSALCTNCHGDDLTGSDTDVSCYSCHSIYPHNGSAVTALYGSNWGSSTAHGSYVNTNGTEDCATECHGTDLSGGLSGISCLTGCHSVAYPHPANWNNTAAIGTIDFHGSVGYGSALTLCTTCHGDDLTGGTSRVSCFSCHENYPHLNANWIADGLDNLHATTFIDLAESGDTEECTVCHGTDYDRLVGGVKCTNCHENGVTHTTDWSVGSGHGTFFSTNFTSDSTEQYCKDCHGDPVTFTDTTTSYSSACSNCHSASKTLATTQTKTVLAAASSCYSCHWSYPHTRYQVEVSSGSSEIDVAWGPTVGTESGDEDGFYYGHAYYIMRNPNFTDASGNAPSAFAPFVSTGYEASMTSNTCGGGTAGSCHYDGARSTTNSLVETDLCTSYCHNN